jgi:hypothetical protein
VMGAIVISHVQPVSTPTPEAASQFVSGFQDALLVAAGVAFVGAVVAVTTVRKHRHADAAEIAEAAA